MPFRWQRHGFWVVAVVCAASLILLGGALYIPRPAAGPPSVTVEWIHWTVEQGSTNGSAWFAESSINESGPLFGFPYAIRPDARFNVSIVLISIDTVAHALCNVSILPPLFVVSTYPPVPVHLSPGEDYDIYITLGSRTSNGEVVYGEGTLSALGCPVPPG